MVTILVDQSTRSFFEALASETRMEIVCLLGKSEMNVSMLSEVMNLSPSIITRHIRVLEDAGIIHCYNKAAKHGIQKICRLRHTGLTLEFPRVLSMPQTNTFEIPVGSFVAWEVYPSCGIATPKGMIGHDDDIRVFSDPKRFDAGLIWVGHGYLEYVAPNYINNSSSLIEIRIQMEICSEAPGYVMDWPSDIFISLNGVLLGCWTSPGDFGDKTGIYTPEWHRKGTSSQYGLLKQIVLNKDGSFIDDKRVSNTTINDIPVKPAEPFRLRIESPMDAMHPHGFNIFGRGFGNYDQHILFTTIAEENSSKHISGVVNPKSVSIRKENEL